MSAGRMASIDPAAFLFGQRPFWHGGIRHSSFRPFPGIETLSSNASVPDPAWRAPRLVDVVPPAVLAQLGSQMREGINEAVVHYPELGGDEDAVTGGLLTEISRVSKGSDAQSGLSWRAYAWKVPGRGRGAAEKHTGADAIVEIEFCDDAGALRVRKSLPVQGKKEWKGRDKLLQDQAQKLASLPGGGIVVDFRASGYSAVGAQTAADAGADRRRVHKDAIHPLGDVLVDAFLGCDIGSADIFYDDAEKLLWVYENGFVRRIPFRARRRLRVQLAPIGHLPPPPVGSRSRR